MERLAPHSFSREEGGSAPGAARRPRGILDQKKRVRVAIWP